MKDRLALGLALILAFGVMTAWVEDDTWAVYVLYALVFGLGAVWSTAWLIRRPPVFCDIPALLLWVLACWSGLQLFFGLTVNRWATMNAALMWAADAVVYLVALQLFSKASRRVRFLRWLLYGGVALSVEALLQFYTANRKIFWIFDTHEQRRIIMGPVPYHNHFAAIIALILPIGASIAVLSSRNFLFYGSLVGVLAGAVVASQSRAGTALVVLELVVLAFSAGKSPVRPRLVRGAALLLLVTVWAALAGWQGLWTRLQHFDGSRAALFRLWRRNMAVRQPDVCAQR